MNEYQRPSRSNFTFFNDLSSFAAHIILAFLPAIVSIALALELAPLKAIFNVTCRYADMLGAHIALLHILGWYRGLTTPDCSQETRRKIRNWITLIALVSSINAAFYAVGKIADFNVVLDLTLMCLAYFNGIYAARYFTKLGLVFFKIR